MGCVYVKQYMFHGLRCAMCTRFVVPGCAMRTLHFILFQVAYITCYFVLDCVHYMLFCSRLRTLHVTLFQVAYITCYFVLGCVHYMLFCSRLRTLHVILFQVAYITCYFVLDCLHYMLFCSRLRKLHVILFQVAYMSAIEFSYSPSTLPVSFLAETRWPRLLSSIIDQVDRYIYCRICPKKNVTGNKVVSFRFLRLFSL